MGGTPLGGGEALKSYDELRDRARQAAGALSLLMVAPFMHGAGQWATFYLVTMGGCIVLLDDVSRLDPAAALRLVEQHRITGIPVVGDAMARPLVDEVEKGGYDLSSLLTITNGGAPLTPGVRERLIAALPHIALVDVIGSSETGTQMNTIITSVHDAASTFTPSDRTTVISADLTRVLAPGGGQGWLAQHGYIPMGYLGDPVKTSRTYPTVDGVRWSLPGDRADYLADGRIALLGRDSLTINTGGEKVFVEEVERAILNHPDVDDVVVVGRPSPRWGHEVVAIVQCVDGAKATDSELLAACTAHIARYKLPKAVVRTSQIARLPAGKADYRWAAAIAAAAPEGEAAVRTAPRDPD